MRLAWFGGSFDPPHRGHLAVAHAAAQQLSLDRVLLAPTGLQPHKRDGAEACYADRFEMVRLLCATDPDLLVASPLDRPHSDGSPNYTVDALQQLRTQQPGDEIFAIVGADSLLDLPRWREARRLFDLATWIAVSRPGHPLLGELQETLHTAQAAGRLRLVLNVEVPITSSEIRSRLHRREDCSALIPRDILQFINEHGLYPASVD